MIAVASILCFTLGWGVLLSTMATWSTEARFGIWTRLGRWIAGVGRRYLKAEREMARLSTPPLLGEMPADEQADERERRALAGHADPEVRWLAAGTTETFDEFVAREETARRDAEVEAALSAAAREAKRREAEERHRWNELNRPARASHPSTYDAIATARAVGLEAFLNQHRLEAQQGWAAKAPSLFLPPDPERKHDA